MVDPHIPDEDPVVRDLAALAAADAPRSAGRHVEHAVTNAFKNQRRRAWFAPAAVAAGLFLALSAGYIAARRGHIPPGKTDPPSSSDAVDPGIVQWARVKVPREYLPQLGIAVIEPGGGTTVEVEVAISEDGRSHAVRVVQ